MEGTSLPVKRRSLRWDSTRRRCRPQSLSNHVGSPYLSLWPQGGQRSYSRGFAWSYISPQQECTEVESRRSSVSSRFRRSVTASGTGTSLPTPPKPGHSSTMPPKSRDLGAGSSAGGSGYGTRPKGRPTYVPQWARPDGGDGPPPPPPPTSLPSWAIFSGSEKMDAAQDHQQTSGVPTSDPNMNTGGTVPPHASGVPTSDQHRNTVGTVRQHGSDRVLQHFSPPVIVPGTSLRKQPSGSARSSSPPVKKMPVPRFARPAPELELPVGEKKPRHHEPAGTSDHLPSSSSMREFQGSTPSSNIYREAQVLVPSSGSGQIAAVNISGLAGVHSPSD